MTLRRRAARLRPGRNPRPGSGAGATGGGELVLVPGTEAPLLDLELPRGLRGQARERIAWRQLRDLLGLTPDQVEMRPYPGGSANGNWQRALVVDAARAARWRARAGAGAQALLPDYLALPAAPDLWVIASDAAGLRVRLGVEDGFSAPPDLAPALIRRALAEAGLDHADPETDPETEPGTGPGTGPETAAADAPAPPPEPAAHRDTQRGQKPAGTGSDTGRNAPRAVLVLDPPPPWLGPLLDRAGLPCVTDAAALAGLGLAPPRLLAHGEMAADLARDPRAEAARLRRRIGPWRWTVLAGALALAVWAGDRLQAIRSAEAETARLRAETTALVRTHFLPQGPILDIRAQVSRALAAAQAEAAAARQRVSPLLLFGQAAEVIAAEGAVTELVRHAKDDGLDLTLRLPDFAATDRLLAALRSAGLAVTLRDARASAADAPAPPEAGDPGRGAGTFSGALSGALSGGVRVELRLRPMAAPGPARPEREDGQ